jgi:beta-glucanase (GH16 family)
MATLPIGLLVAMTVAPLPRVSELEPVLHVPTSALAGQTIAAGGSGFPAHTAVQLSWNGEPNGMPSARTDPAGAFRVLLTVPAAAPVGDHELGAFPRTGRALESPAARERSQAPAASASVTIRVVDDTTSAPGSPSGFATPFPSPTSVPTPTPLPTPTAVPPTAAPVIPPATLKATPKPALKATPKPASKATPKPTPKPTPTTAPSSRWTSIFRDDFNYSIARGAFPGSVGSRWHVYPKGWKDTSRNGTYDPSIIAVANGKLDVHIQTTAGVHRVAAFGPRLGTNNAQLYGRYEIRFRADSMRGYKGAWLLWPASGVWPRDGEIDFPEGEFDGTIYAFMHRQGATRGSDQDAFRTSARWTDWHTAVLEWMPSAVRFYLDGRLIGTSTSRIPNTPMEWIIQNETTLAGFEPADSVQGHVQIDYVQVWRYNP